MISLMSDMNLRATNEQTRKKAHRQTRVWLLPEGRGMVGY